jgi:hypothetical protein
MYKSLRDYQIDSANKGIDILNKYNILYLSMQVRCGKTATSMEVAKLYGAKKVLFLTKKKAISSIQSDYEDFGYSEHFEIMIVNDESMHKIEDPKSFDLIVHDEHHRFGAMPKPGASTKLFRSLFADKPMIFLSGTMCPESFSQMYHQFWVSNRSPWSSYRNFYKWSADYVNVKQKKINSFTINDYSAGIEDKIMGDISKYMLTYTQEQAGFQSKIDEEVLYCKMLPKTYDIANRLLKDLVVEGKDEVILGDTPAKLLQKIHQLYSGTIKFESGNSMVLDTTKAEFIRSRFATSKIGIFYVFKEELNALKQVYGDNLTTDLDEFNSTDKAIALQIVSGREGISLKNADYLVFYNIQHSAVSYFQGIDRMTTIDRLNNKIYWIFSEGGIEEKIYKVVKSKKKYTTNIFKKDYSVKFISQKT